MKLIGTRQWQTCLARPPDYIPPMTLLQELEQKAGKLPETERATLVFHLLASLPLVLAEADEGVATAKRRDAELDANPSLGLSDQQFRAAIAASRKR